MYHLFFCEKCRMFLMDQWLNYDNDNFRDRQTEKQATIILLNIKIKIKNNIKNNRHNNHSLD